MTETSILLDREILPYLSKGYTVQSRSETMAVLELDNKFSTGWFLFGFFLFWPVFLVQGWRAIQPHGVVTLTVSQDSVLASGLTLSELLQAKNRARTLSLIFVGAVVGLMFLCCALSFIGSVSSPSSALLSMI